MDGKPQAVNDEPSEAQVAEYLRRNPGFFQNRPELLSAIEPPVRDLGDGVHDFQHALIQRLKTRVEETTEVAQELIDTTISIPRPACTNASCACWRRPPSRI